MPALAVLVPTGLAGIAWDALNHAESVPPAEPSLGRTSIAMLMNRSFQQR